MSDKKYDLTILTIKDPPLPDPIEQDSRLPNVSQGACILDVAKPRSGKSVRIVNLLMNPNFFAEKFDECFIYSPTIGAGDHTTRHLYDRYKRTIYNEYSDKHLQGLLDYLDSIPKEQKGRYCIVFDDFIAFGFLKPNSLMFRMASSYRHHLNGGMLYYSTQQLKKCPPIVRASANYVIISQNSNVKQVEAMSEEFGVVYGAKRWLKLYEECTAEPFSFMYLDCYGYTLDNNHRPKIYKRFDELIYEAPISYKSTDRDLEDIIEESDDDTK